MLGALLSDRLAERGDYAMVDLAPVRPEIAASLPLYRCGGCQLELARKAGAGYALNVIVRKMSTLVQEITLVPLGLDPQQQRRCLASGAALHPRARAARIRLRGSKRPRHEGVGSDREPGGALA
jgi:Protein of unknown function (DUF2380)